MTFFISDIDSELEKDRKIEADRIRVSLLCSRFPFILLMYNACSLLLLYVFWSQADRFLLLGWTALVWLSVAMTYGLTRRFSNTTACKGAPGKCLYYYFIGILFTSTIFGAAGWYFHAYEQFIYQAIIPILLLVISTAAIILYPASFRVYIAYSLPINLPFLLMCFVHGGERYIMIGTIGFFLLGILELSAWRISKSIGDSIDLQIDNRDLVKELAHEVAIRREAESTVRSRDDKQLEGGAQ